MGGGGWRKRLERGEEKRREGREEKRGNRKEGLLSLYAYDMISMTFFVASIAFVVSTPSGRLV
jgi:hypothetical protein